MLKQASITPTLPQTRRDASLPELRSRLESILNVPHGKERVLAHLGRAGEIGTPAVLSSPAAALTGLFEHPYGI